MASRSSLGSLSSCVVACVKGVPLHSVGSCNGDGVPVGLTDPWSTTATRKMVQPRRYSPVREPHKLLLSDDFDILLTLQNIQTAKLKRSVQADMALTPPAPEAVSLAPEIYTTTARVT